jgi:CRP-like cAMP-binding protein
MMSITKEASTMASGGRIQKADILQAAQSRTLHAGGFLSHQGEPAIFLHLLVNGLVKVTGVSSSGTQVLFNWLRPGDVVGIGAILTPPALYIWSAIALEECRTLQWSRGAINGLRAKWPALYDNALWIALQWGWILGGC